MHVWWKQLYTVLVRQIRRLCLAHADRAIAREVWGHALPRKIIKIEIESEGIFKNIYSYRDNFTLAVHTHNIFVHL